ncbi:MAG: hypothetical protein H7837_10835 [Magnetococcus sp. MYC-9]
MTGSCRTGHCYPSEELSAAPFRHAFEMAVVANLTAEELDSGRPNPGERTVGSVLTG